MDNSRCVILVPASRHIEPHCEFSLRQLEAQGYTVRRLYGFAQIDVGATGSRRRRSQTTSRN